MKQTNNALSMLLKAYRSIFKSAYFKGMASAVVLTAGLAAGQAGAVTWDAANGVTGAERGNIVIDDNSAVNETLTVNIGDNITITSGADATFSGGADVGIEMDGGTLFISQNSGGASNNEPITVDLDGDVNIRGGNLIVGSGGAATSGATILTDGNFSVSTESGKTEVTLNKGAKIGSDGTDGTVTFGNGVVVNVNADTTNKAVVQGSDIQFQSGSTVNVSGTLTISGAATFADGVLVAQSSNDRIATANNTSELILSKAAYDTFKASSEQHQGGYDMSSGGTLTISNTSEDPLELVSGNFTNFTNSNMAGTILVGSEAFTINSNYITVESNISGSATGDLASLLTLEADSLTLGSAEDANTGSLGFSGAIVHNTLNLVGASASSTVFNLHDDIVLSNDGSTVGQITGADLVIANSTPGTLKVQGSWEIGNITLSGSALSFGDVDTKTYTEATDAESVLTVNGSLKASSNVTLATAGSKPASLIVSGTLDTVESPSGNVKIQVNDKVTLGLKAAEIETELNRESTVSGYGFQIQSGATLAVDASESDFTVDVSKLNANQTDGSGGIGISGSVVVNGNATLTYTADDSDLLIDDDGKFIVNGNLTIDQLNASGQAFTFSGGTVQVNGGTFTAADGDLTFSGNSSNDPALILSEGATGNVKDVTVNIANGGSGALTVNSGSSLIIDGKLTLTKGTVTVDGDGSTLTVDTFSGAASDATLSVVNGATLSFSGDGLTNTADITGNAKTITADGASTIDLGKINDTLSISAIADTGVTQTTNPFTSNNNMNVASTTDVIVDLKGVSGFADDGSTVITQAQIDKLTENILGSSPTTVLTIEGAKVEITGDATNGYYSYDENRTAISSATDETIQHESFLVSDDINEASGVNGDVGTMGVEGIAGADGELTHASQTAINVTEGKGLTLRGDAEVAPEGVLTAVVVNTTEGSATTTTRYVAGLTAKDVNNNSTIADGTAVELLSEGTTATAYVGDIGADLTVTAHGDVTVLKSSTKVSDIDFTKDIPYAQLGNVGTSAAATGTATLNGTVASDYTAANFYLTNVDGLADGSTVNAVFTDVGNTVNGGEIYVAGNADAENVQAQNLGFYGNSFTAADEFILGAQGEIVMTGTGSKAVFEKDATNLGSVTAGTLEISGDYVIGQLAEEAEDPAGEPSTQSLLRSAPVVATESYRGENYHQELTFGADGAVARVENGYLALGSADEEADNRAIINAYMAETGANAGLYIGNHEASTYGINTITSGNSGSLVVGNYAAPAGGYAQDQSYFGGDSVTVVDFYGTDNNDIALDSSVVNLTGDAKLVVLNAKMGSTITNGNIVVADGTSYDPNAETGAWAGDNLYFTNGFLGLSYEQGVGLEVAAVDEAVSRERYNKLTQDEFEMFQDVALYGGESEFVYDIMNSALSYDDQARAIDSVGRMALNSGVVQGTLLASKTTTDAIAQRTGVGAIGSIATVSAQTAKGASVWLTPIYANSDSDSYDAGSFEYGADVDLYGAALGVDYTADSGFTVGVAMNVGSGDADSQGDLYDTSADLDYFGLAVYGAWEYNNFKLAADVGYTFVSADIDQNNVMDKFTTDTDSTIATVGLAAKYTFELGLVDVAPHVGVRYLHLNVDDYDVYGQEYGYLMHGDSIDADIVQFPIGVTLSSEFAAGDWTIKPALDLSVIPAAGDTDVDSDVAIDGYHLGYNTDVMSSCSYGGTLGIEAAYGNAAFGLSYSYFGSSDEDSQGLMVNARYTF